MTGKSIPARLPLHKGSVLMGVFLVALVALIFMTSLVMLQRDNARQSVRSLQKSRALEIAENALARLDVVFETFTGTVPAVMRGETPAGYLDDREFSDIPGGIYKVLLSSGPQHGQFTALVKARESATGEIRAISAVYEPFSFHFAWAYNADPPNVTIHWGAVKSYGFSYGAGLSIANRYPRKFSKDAVPGLDTNPALPNSGPDYAAYWSPQTSWDDLTLYYDDGYYLSRASKSSIPVQTATGEFVLGDPAVRLMQASPIGSGVFNSDINCATGRGFRSFYLFRPRAGAPMGTGYTFRSSTSVIFMEYLNSSCGIQGGIALDPYTFLEVEGIFGYNGSAQSSLIINGPGTGVIQATIPLHADLEYQHPNGQAVWTAGSPSMRDIWQRPSRCCYTISGVSYAGAWASEGFLYLGGTADPVIFGAWSSDNNSVTSAPYGRHGTLYYDESLKSRIVPERNKQPRRVGWDEVSVPW